MSDPLRVGLVCPYSFDRYGGVQNHVLGLARYLREQGHAPHILAPGSPDPTLLDDLTFTSAGTAIPVPYNGSVARVNFGLRTAARVHRWLRNSPFDVLHLHEPVTPSVSLLALWLGRSPIVATFHTATPRSRTMAVAGGVLRGWIDKIDAGLAVSEPARQVVVDHLGRDAVVVPNGLRHAEFGRRTTVADSPGSSPGSSSSASPASSPASSSSPSRWRGGDRPRVTFLGRLDERRKGLDVLLAALPAIAAAVPDVDVVVAGSGSRALPPPIRTLGAISNDDKTALLGATDVFVAPHRERESFGLVLVEALASGAEVVASDLPAFIELLRRDGHDLGLLVPVGDPTALATAVVDRLAGRTPSSQPAAAAAVARFDWSVVGATITDVYRGVLPRDALELTAFRELR